MQAGAATFEEVVTEETSVRVTMAESDKTDTSVYVDYTKPEQIAMLADSIYPNDLIGYDWDGGRVRNDDYEVYVFFKNGSVVGKTNGITAYYGFLDGQVPESVQEETAYKE